MFHWLLHETGKKNVWPKWKRRLFWSHSPLMLEGKWTMKLTLFFKQLPFPEKDKTLYREPMSVYTESI
jgi:hypothetical protein